MATGPFSTHASTVVTAPVSMISGFESEEETLTMPLDLQVEVEVEVEVEEDEGVAALFFSVSARK